MNRTVLAVIVLAVIIAIAGYLFYGKSTGDTVVEPAAPAGMAPAPAAPPAP
jgi:hypothetical protein